MSTYIQSSINTATLINASEKRRQTRTAQTLPSEAKVGRSFCNFLVKTQNPPPQVVICGGGAQGAAIAYRLAEAGWGDGVVMLEQVRLSSGTGRNPAATFSVGCRQDFDAQTCSTSSMELSIIERYINFPCQTLNLYIFIYQRYYTLP